MAVGKLEKAGPKLRLPDLRGRGYHEVKVQADGWSEVVCPDTRFDYRLSCCDCGLVHAFRFSRPIAFRVKRLNRHTASHRARKEVHFDLTFLRYAYRCIVATYMGLIPVSGVKRRQFVRTLAKDLGLRVRFD